MPFDLQRYLAIASERVIPSGRGLTVIKDILQEMRGVIDLTPQSTEIEWDDHFLTATVTSFPQFSIPATAFDEITVYHHLSVLSVPGGTAPWFATVSYPGLGFPIRFLEAIISDTTTRDLLRVDPAGDIRKTIALGAPLVVFPTGSLLIQRGTAILGAETSRCSYVRQVFGGPASAELQTDLTGGFV